MPTPIHHLLSKRPNPVARAARMTRRFLRSVCRGLVGAMLFSQLAIAAYACPALASAGSPASASETTMAGADGQAMSNCEGMTRSADGSLPNLCAAHCQYGQQSGQASTLNVPCVCLAALYATPLAPEAVAAPPRAVAFLSRALAAASPPPHAILHCCFRI